MNFLFYESLKHIPLGIAVAIESTGPLAVAFWASRKPLDFLWGALAVVGIVLVLPVSQQSSAALDPVGVAYALSAGVCWALYIVCGQRAGSSTHAGIVTTLGISVAATVVLPIGVAHAGSKLFQVSLLPIALSVAVLTSVIPYSFEMMALKRLPAKNYGILMSLEPMLGAASGLLFLGEHLTRAQWIAVFCIVLASAGSSASIPRRKDK